MNPNNLLTSALGNYRKASCGAKKCRRRPGCFKSLDVEHEISTGSLVIAGTPVIPAEITANTKKSGFDVEVVASYEDACVAITMAPVSRSTPIYSMDGVSLIQFYASTISTISIGDAVTGNNVAPNTKVSEVNDNLITLDLALTAMPTGIYTFTSSASLCTGWLYRNDEAEVPYLITAAHCVVPDYNTFAPASLISIYEDTTESPEWSGTETLSYITNSLTTGKEQSFVLSYSKDPGYNSDPEKVMISLKGFLITTEDGTQTTEKITQADLYNNGYQWAAFTRTDGSDPSEEYGNDKWGVQTNITVFEWGVQESPNDDIILTAGNIEIADSLSWLEITPSAQLLEKYPGADIQLKVDIIISTEIYFDFFEILIKNGTPESTLLIGGPEFNINDPVVLVSNVDGTNKNRLFNTQVIGYDGRGDYAVCKIINEQGLLKDGTYEFSSNWANHPTLQFATTAPLKGSVANIIGYPLGSDYNSFSSGSVRDPYQAMVEQPNAILVDTAINSGNSGGAICNEMGEVIGMSTFSYTGAENLGGGPNSELLKKFIPKIINSYNDMKNGSIGKAGYNKDKNNRSLYRLPKSNLRLNASPLNMSGLRALENVWTGEPNPYTEFWEEYGVALEDPNTGRPGLIDAFIKMGFPMKGWFFGNFPYWGGYGLYQSTGDFWTTQGREYSANRDKINPSLAGCVIYKITYTDQDGNRQTAHLDSEIDNNKDNKTFWDVIYGGILDITGGLLDVMTYEDYIERGYLEIFIRELVPDNSSIKEYSFWIFPSPMSDSNDTPLFVGTNYGPGGITGTSFTAKTLGINGNIGLSIENTTISKRKEFVETLKKIDQ